MFPYPGCVTTLKRKKSCQPCTVMMRPVSKSTSGSTTVRRTTRRTVSKPVRFPVRKTTTRKTLTAKKPATCIRKKVPRGTVGSRAQVMHGTKNHTPGSLQKTDLKYKNGRIVSKCKSDLAKMRWKKQMQNPEFRKKWMMFTKKK